MRALRPRSPSATTAALIEGNVEGEAKRLLFYPAGRLGHEPVEQIFRDAMTIGGRRADVVDRRDLVGERTVRLGLRTAGGQHGFRARQTENRAGLRRFEG